MVGSILFLKTFVLQLPRALQQKKMCHLMKVLEYCLTCIHKLIALQFLCYYSKQHVTYVYPEVFPSQLHDCLWLEKYISIFFTPLHLQDFLEDYCCRKGRVSISGIKSQVKCSEIHSFI